MAIRLVAFDLDGTLIRGRNSLAVTKLDVGRHEVAAVGDSPRDASMFRAARSRGASDPGPAGGAVMF
jgi:hydroxymethylpyrimidine pyrophosphatase-like HAD family hydrolase